MIQTLQFHGSVHVPGFREKVKFQYKFGERQKDRYFMFQEYSLLL